MGRGSRDARIRILISGGAGLFLAFAGLVGPGATAVHADPIPPPSTCLLAGRGSDALTPLVDAFAGAVQISGVRVLCDLGKPGVVPQQRPAVCQQYVGASGSGGGRSALLTSLAANDGCLQFAWSSSLNLTAASTGLTHVPFATDAVTYAVTDTSQVPRALTPAQVQAIYHCDPVYVGSGPAYTLHPLIPQVGSGVRGRWESLMGITDADLAAGAYPCITDTVNGQAVAENDGRMLSSSSIIPYSISRYAAQLSGTALGLRSDAVLGSAGTNA